MQILLLSATELECRPCFNWLDSNPGLPVVRVVSGIGQLAAAVALQKQVSFQKPDIILQAGIAGSSEPADIGQVFSVNSEVLADLGAEETDGFRDIFTMNLADRHTPPFSGGFLPNPWNNLMTFAGLPTRPGITVNLISMDKELIATRKQKYPLFVESMEGAALHYVAIRENIPFLQVRAISNEAGDRDKSRWRLKDSVAALNACLQPLIQKLITTDETHFRI